MERKLSSFHDYELVGIDSSSLPVVVFTLQGDGEEKRLCFYDVELFRVSDYIKQNVVNRIIVTPTDQLERPDVKRAIIWGSSLSDTSSLIRDDSIEEYVNKIIGEELHLVLLEPSWGAEAVVVCKSFQIGNG